jgi:hypothetical protein
MDFYLNDTINWLLSSVDVGQFSPKLYADVNEKETTPRSQDSTSQDSPENEEGNEISEEEDDRRHNPNCLECGLNNSSPTGPQLIYINKCIEIIKCNGDIQSILDRSSRRPTSTNLADYLLKPVQLLLPHDDVAGLCELSCWNKDCSGHVSKRSDGCKSITVKEYRYRPYECMDHNGFLIYHKFFCKVCRRSKNATDMVALAEMGVPVFIIQRYHFVIFQKTIWSKPLVETMNSYMTGTHT